MRRSKFHGGPEDTQRHGFLFLSEKPRMEAESQTQMFGSALLERNLIIVNNSCSENGMRSFLFLSLFIEDKRSRRRSGFRWSCLIMAAGELISVVMKL